MCKNDLIWLDLTVSLDVTAPLSFSVESFKFGKYEKKGKWSGTLDSGLSVLVFPEPLFNVLDQMIPIEWDDKLALFTVDCDQADVLGDLVFTMSGNEFRLTSKHYIIDVSLIV
jgi:hypothetical protein